MHEPLWNVAALAAFLGKPTSWVYDDHVKENIPSFRIGQQLRFSPSEILRWMASNCREAA
ncbi:helix-turn-helix domain-containing protein [Streptomyces olivaceiscleroticus]|uniref:helix-turn-helix domain-containing protein n=1 Tax=Streptomyces olivaceiscleroticus TaxID=68245 RepID=UPI0031F87369